METLPWIANHTERAPILAAWPINRRGRPGLGAYLPVPVLLLALILAFLFGSPVSYTLERTQTALHLLFTFSAPLCAAVLLERRFRATGEPWVLMLGAGTALWACTGIFNSLVTDNVNTMVSVHNLGAWFASVFHLTAAILLQQRAGARLGNRSWWFLGALAAALGIALLILVGAKTGVIPAFFHQGHGGTAVRQFVLSLAIGTYVFTGVILWADPGGRELDFVRWYCLFLLLFAMGLAGTLAQKAAGSLLGWVGRTAQYLSVLYLLMTAWMASLDRTEEGLSLQAAFGRRALRALVALILVMVATAFRLVFLGVLGSQLVFVTYFPAVTLAALYGGLQAGIAATLLSGLLALVLFMQPAGGLVMVPHVAWLALGLFLASGGLVSLAVANLHRAQARAAAAEAREAAALERERAAATLRQTVEELQRSNRELEQFAYVASHDLQEPLRMVLVFLDLLRDRCETRLDDKEAFYLLSAAEGAERMRRLIHDLLAYSRVGAEAREPAPVALETALAMAQANLSEAIRESGARITHEPLPTVLGIFPLLTQVLQNLLGNAIKFRSAAPAAIHLDARRQGPFWLLSVHDNGIGFEAEHGERIFEIFQRLQTRDDLPGTGIGLAICRKVVECHGGRIWVESSPGRGATFHFTLRAASGVPG